MQQTVGEPIEGIALHKAGFVRQSTQNKIAELKQNTTKRATNSMRAEGVAQHKPGVCEAKQAKHKLLTTKACKNYGSGRESTKTLRGAEG